MPSPAIDDYLKTIYHHTEWQDDRITPSQLAAELSLAPSSVTEMVQKLAAQGLVTHRPYGPIAQSKEHGAWSLVRALVDPEVEGGEFWGPSTGSRGEPRRHKAAKITRDLEVAARLWRACEAATGVRWPLARAAKVAEQ